MTPCSVAAQTVVEVTIQGPMQSHLLAQQKHYVVTSSRWRWVVIKRLWELGPEKMLDHSHYSSIHLTFNPDLQNGVIRVLDQSHRNGRNAGTVHHQ